MKHLLIFQAMLTCLLAPGGVQAQNMYRTGQPDVLNGAAERTRQQKETGAGAMAAFQVAYQRAKRPTFLMMWHRELSDKIDSGHEASATVASTGVRARDNFERTVKVQWKDGSESAVSLLAPARAAAFESGFQQTLRNAGVVLVDRNTAVRMTALKKVNEGARESALNFQTVEATALADFAKYFIELRFVPNAQAPGDSMPRITVIESHSGAILVDVLPTEAGKPAEGKWTAGSNGFVKEPDEAQQENWNAVENKGFVKQARPRSMQEDGQQAAVALMKAMTSSW